MNAGQTKPWILLALLTLVTLLLSGCEFHQRAVPGAKSGAADNQLANSQNPEASASAEGSLNVEGARSADSAGDPTAASESPDTNRTTDAADAAAAAPANKTPLPIESTSRRAVGRGDGIEVITFDDLNIGMQADMAFRDFLLTDRVKELDGKRVRLIGYMHGGVSQIKDLTEFVLLQNTQCKFGPGGQADHLVRVLVKPGVAADYATGAIQVEGTLKVVPFQGPDGNTWSVYDMTGENVKLIRK
ncbi:MAG: hypothetical protein ACKOU6_14425 [Planctomycetota bacterium]